MISVNGNPIQVNTNFVSDVSDWYNLKEIKIGDQIWADRNLDYKPVNFNPGVYSRSAVNGYDLGEQYYYPVRSLNYELTHLFPEWKWRIPTSADFQTLIDYCGGSDNAGNVLKSTYAWNDNYNGIDTYGFNALPVGSAGTTYANVGGATVFATTTTANTTVYTDYSQYNVYSALWVVGLDTSMRMRGWFTNMNQDYVYPSFRLIKDV